MCHVKQQFSLLAQKYNLTFGAKWSIRFSAFFEPGLETSSAQSSWTDRFVHSTELLANYRLVDLQAMSEAFQAAVEIS
jgi:hypothetical protein